MGFVEGSVYDLSVSIGVTEYPIMITAVDDKGDGTKCHYDSLEKLFGNWEFGMADKYHIEYEFNDHYKVDSNISCISCETDEGCCPGKHKKCLCITGILLIIGIIISELSRL